jgi:hypothetical protein
MTRWVTPVDIWRPTRTSSIGSRTTSPYELLDLWFEAKGELPPGGMHIHLQIVWDALVRIAPHLRPHHGVTLCSKHQEFTINYSESTYSRMPGGLRERLLWAQEIEMAAQREWDDGLPGLPNYLGGPGGLEAQAYRRGHQDGRASYTRHAIRAYHCSVIRRIIPNPCRERS